MLVLAAPKVGQGCIDGGQGVLVGARMRRWWPGPEGEGRRSWVGAGDA